MRLNLKKSLIKFITFVLAFAALIITPFNASLVFGYGGSPSAPSCNDAAAGSAPTLISARATGANQVTLTWSKAADPVTHYVISYGLASGKPLYGNPNVGGKNTTSYTVGDLSGGTTYYFRVRAGNGCNGGAYSNEVAVTPGGRVISTPASGFIRGVLGAAAERVNSKIVTTTPKTEITEQTSGKSNASSTTPEPVQTSAPKKGNIITNFFAGLFSFFGHLFGK